MSEQQPVPRPTPVEAGIPSPEITVPVREFKPVRQAVGTLILAPLALVLLLSSLTVGSYTQPGDAFTDVRRSGTARALDCQRLGPVSRHGFGYWYDCRANVTWSDGTRSRVTTRASVLSPADLGREVAVKQFPPTRNSAGDVFRADHPPRAWGVAPFFVLFVAGLLCGLAAVMRVNRLVRAIRSRT